MRWMGWSGPTCHFQLHTSSTSSCFHLHGARWSHHSWSWYLNIWCEFLHGFLQMLPTWNHSLNIKNHWRFMGRLLHSLTFILGNNLICQWFQLELRHLKGSAPCWNRTGTTSHLSGFSTSSSTHLVWFVLWWRFPALDKTQESRWPICSIAYVEPTTARAVQ